jgi:hypothetical protein
VGTHHEPYGNNHFQMTVRVLLRRTELGKKIGTGPEKHGNQRKNKPHKKPLLNNKTIKRECKKIKMTFIA